jgi:hypothetical protein
MKPDDKYEAWLKQRQDVSPPEDLADRIMAAIESPSSPLEVPAGAPAGFSASIVPSGKSHEVVPPRQPLARLGLGPLLLCTAASLIFVARIAALVGNLVFPTGSYPEFATDQRIEELPHEHRNVSRS